MNIVLSFTTMPENGTEKGDETSHPDIIPSLIDSTPFKVRPEEEKHSILQGGRPIPKLNIVKRDALKNCNRTFKDTWYNTHRWLCGSSQLNKLFCWPCLLMRPETSSWCSTGSDDVKRLSSMSSKHALCKAHLKAINEYDATLVSFGLMPEFPLETNCKEEKDNALDSDDDDGQDDIFDQMFSDESKKRLKSDFASPFTKDIRSKTHNETAIPNQNHVNNSEGSSNANSSFSPARSKLNPMSFKVWQEMNRSSLSSMNSHWVNEKRLSKLKRKVVKQELRNAQMVAEKIHLEIELLKAQLDYQNELNKEFKSSSHNKPDEVHGETSSEAVNLVT